MMRMEIPDYDIKIGIKDGKVIKVDWEHLYSFEKDKNIPKLLKKYLREAEKFVGESEKFIKNTCGRSG